MRRTPLRTSFAAALLLTAAALVAPGAAGAATPPGPTGAQTAPAAPSATEMPAEAPAPERVLGDPDAPVTIIEYASMTCPHCRTFHVQVLPSLRSAYIDTGKVRLVFRDYPLDHLALAAAMVARCATTEKTMEVTTRLFETQAKWTAAEDPIAAIAEAVAPFGLDEAAVEACVSDEAAARPVIEQAMHGRETYEIRSTPTFIVNGEIMVGVHAFQDFEAKIEAALK